jgi:hypothetical protein
VWYAVTFDEWAARWCLPDTALAELATVQWETVMHPSGSEAAVQANVRLKAAALGWHLWRNNLGAAELKRGGFVRFGLANDSPKLNAVLKSADLIGHRPHLVTPEDVGRTLAVFLSIEVKRSGWSPSADPRYPAQLRWAALVNRCGGDARFVTDAGQLC